ncbi:bifunctional transcriptional activator/DNA repair enzyme AdaA [Aestuariispira ectoiniformans]|uniref:bifunctional transcriptional activator/DNA repair enzyme AdaA n=1 Tax=Aestuariispira ectoiniformans TaxID=2775080 RepID=UPI00223C322E|nr:trifunctional transcriptional activator/DNA repair protein Ada/methylated-DNA--[protein]-cysteine S-methyltransferase [Aestuariispira ectoiniformans]
MLFETTNDDDLYDAFMARDPAYDGFAYVGVKSTGIFCRLTCPARKPKRENAVFFATVSECMESGFRPCKRCKPLVRAGEADPMIRALTDALEREPERRWCEEDIVRMGFDPSTVRRGFKRHFGITFLEMARLRRVGKVTDQLASGGSVIDAQLDAGFDSGSGFRAAFKRLLGQPPVNLRGGELLTADWIDTPVGAMIAVADRHALHLLEFHDRKALPTELKKLQIATKSAVGIGRQPPIDQIEAELKTYFSGESANFRTPLVLHGSSFTRNVWQSLQRIPAGETQSYSRLAADMGRPTAVRAVARANGANQIAIVIPCHRVLGADGSLTGYGGGLWRKRWLLEHERRMASLN